MSTARTCGKRTTGGLPMRLTRRCAQEAASGGRTREVDVGVPQMGDLPLYVSA